MSAHAAELGIEQRQPLTTPFANLKESFGKGTEFISDRAANVGRAVVNLAGGAVERVKDTAADAWNSASNMVGKRTAILAATAALAVSGAGLAETAVDSAFAKTTPVEKTSGSGSNDGGNAVATASDQLEDCVDAALAKPLVMRSRMAFPGDSQDARQQKTDAFIRFKPTSDVCAPLVSRETPTARMKMQRPNNHKKFIRSKSKELIGNEDGIEVPMDANGSRYGYVAFGRNSGESNKLRYRCTPGKGITKAWMTYTVRAFSPVDGSTLGKKSFTQPIKIARTRPDLVTDNGVAGPC